MKRFFDFQLFSAGIVRSQNDIQILGCFLISELTLFLSSNMKINK